MIEVSTKYNKSNDTINYLLTLNKKVRNIESILQKYGSIGCEALSYYTPFDTGETAMSWSFDVIKHGEQSYELRFNNSKVVDGVNIALILQTGHPTKSGTWVEGEDYINPALRPVFDEIARKAWGEIKAL